MSSYYNVIELKQHAEPSGQCCLSNDA